MSSSLLAKHGYALSGFIDNLDERDPELVYFKRLTLEWGDQLSKPWS